MALPETNSRTQTRRGRRTGSQLYDPPRHLQRDLKRQRLRGKDRYLDGIPRDMESIYQLPWRPEHDDGQRDKVYYTYGGSASTDITTPFSNKWKILSGTGKYKGIKGSGTCSGKNYADGSSDAECIGTYSMGK